MLIKDEIIANMIKTKMKSKKENVELFETLFDEVIEPLVTFYSQKSYDEGFKNGIESNETEIEFPTILTIGRLKKILEKIDEDEMPVSIQRLEDVLFSECGWDTILQKIPMSEYIDEYDEYVPATSSYVRKYNKNNVFVIDAHY